MKAITLSAYGDVSNLHKQDLPEPTIKEGEVLVQVKAISINPVDVKTRIGKGAARFFRDEQPIILGWDISGVVTRTSAEGFEVGDEVFGMVNFPGRGRAYAEYVAASQGHLALKPASVSHEEGAAACLAALTAYQALVTKAKVRPGQRVLVHAASGGVGHYAVQIARHLGAYVIGTSSAANRDFVLSLGAQEHVDYKAVRFEDVVHDVDMVLDTIGGDNIDRSLEVVKPGGTIISIPSGLSESVTEKARAKGVFGYHFMVSSNGNDMRELGSLLEKGALKSHIFQVFDFDHMGDAHLAIESGRTVGKIVLKP